MRLKTGEVLCEKSYISPRPPPKISLRHDHDWTRGNDELGSTVEQQPVGKLVQQSCGEVQHATFSKLTQPKPKPICDRSGKPDNTEDVFVVKGETSRSHEIDEKGLHEEFGSSDRSGKPDKLSENTRVNVKGMNPAPHIHEHLRYTIMATALRTPSRITTSRLSTLR